MRTILQSLLFLSVAFCCSCPAALAVPFNSSLLLKLDANPANVVQEATTGLNGQPRVSQWTDTASLGGTNNATQTSDLRRPEFYGAVATLNNQPALRFVGTRPDIGGDPDGQTDEMNLFGIGTGNFTSNQATLFAVVSIDNVTPFATQYTLYADNNTDNHWQFSGGAGYSGTFRSPRFEGSIPAGGAAQSGKVVFDIASGTNYTWNENGVSKGSSTGGTFTTGANHLLGNSIGNPQNDKAFEGYVAEVLVYNSVLNDAQRLITNNYLGAKFDVAQSVATDHYAGKDSGNDNYDFGVFGIGRFDAANEVTTDTFGEGLSISAANSSLGDGEWLLAGQKVATNSLITSGGLTRWQRVWFLDKTVTPITGALDATLTFDFSDGGLIAPAFGAGTSVDLLYSSSSALNFNALSISGTILGDSISFLVPNAMLLDGYYTLGISAVPEPSGLGLLGLGLLALRRKMRPRQTVQANN